MGHTDARVEGDHADLPPTLRSQQVANLLDVRLHHVYELARRGGLVDNRGHVVVPVIRLGRTIRWPTAAVLRLVRGEVEVPEGADDGAAP